MHGCKIKAGVGRTGNKSMFNLMLWVVISIHMNTCVCILTRDQFILDGFYASRLVTFFVIPFLGGKAPQLTCSAAEASVPEIWMAYMLHDSFRFLLSQSLEAKRSNLRAVQQKLLYQRSGWLICFMIVFVFCYPSPWRQSAPTCVQCNRSVCTRDLDGLYAS